MCLTYPSLHLCSWTVYSAVTLVVVTQAERAALTAAQAKAAASEGVFLVKMKNAFIPFERIYSMNKYSRISTVPRGSEGSE